MMSRRSYVGVVYASDAGKNAETKYRDPKTGETWTGRGRPAGWLQAHLDAGRKKEDFLIKK